MDNLNSIQSPSPAILIVDDNPQNLQTLILKLINLDKAKTDFLNHISHEIRTPLIGIICILGMLKGPLNADKIIELIEMLDSSIKRLEKFSLDALLITKLKTKPGEINKEEIELTKLINELLIEYKEKHSTGNIRIRKKYGIFKGIISGGAELKKKCIGNILENAVHFSPDHGIIEVNCSADNQNIICEIKDYGKRFETGN